MKTINSFGKFILLATGLLGGLFILSSTVSAAEPSVIESVKFLNASVVQVEFTNGQKTLLVDDNTNDDTIMYTDSQNSHSCDGTIVFADFNTADNLMDYIDQQKLGDGRLPSSVTASLDVDYPPNCDAIGDGGFIETAVTDFGNARHFYRFEDSATIVPVGDTSDRFVRSEDFPNIYFRVSDGEYGTDPCVDFIELKSQFEYRLYDLGQTGGESGGTDFADSTPDELLIGCEFNDQKGEDDHIYGYLGHDPHSRSDALFIGNSSAAPENINEISEEEQAEIDGNSANATDPEESCENDGGDLSFIICPLLRAADAAVSYLNGLIEELLFVPESYTEGTDLRTSWARVRNLAYFVLLPIMMVMVISTALGFEFFSSYTVKKAMPRMFIALIFIAASFDLLQFLITFINAIGGGMYGFITGVVSPNEPITLASLFNSNAGTDTLTIFISAIGLTTLAVFGSIGILLSYAFVTSVAFLIAVFLLALRQMLIITLMLIAPLAILAWIFPGNDKLWKLWWGSFWKLLLLYPLIMLLVAGGHIFAYIVHDAPVDGLMQTGLKLLGFVAPYFFIPAMFKFAGGVFGTLTGMVNDRGRGLFDRQRKYRGRKMGENFQKTRNYQRFSDKSKFGRGANAILGGAVNPRDAARGRSGIRAGMRTGRVNQGAEALKNDATYQAHQEESEFLLALANEDLAKQKLATAQRKFDTATNADDRLSAQREIIARQSGLDNARRVNNRKSSGVRLQALNKLASTGYEFAPGERGYQELQDTVAGIVGPDQAAQTAAMDTAQFNLKGGGRLDLAGINHGAGLDAKTGIRKMGNYQRGQGKTDTYHAGAEEWLGANTVGDNGKTIGDTAQLSAAIEAGAANDPARMQEVAEWHSMLVRDYESATDANKLEIAKQMEAIQQFAARANNGATPTDQATLDAQVAMITRIQSDMNYRAGQMSPAQLNDKK